MTKAASHADEVVLDVRGLHKRYAGADTPALHDVSLTLRRGEVLGVLGPNGAGKTTTVEILTGFRDRTGGEVRLLGLDPAVRADLRELRRRVGVVLQQTGHYRYLTARETIEMHRAWYPDPRGVDEVIELVGLEEVAHKRVRQLSGGQQRRLDVGVALVGRPEVIFLDEPTTGFDPAARRRAWDVIGELARLGTSVVLTTHYMEEAARLADRVIVIGAGRVIGEGTPEALARDLRLATIIRATIPHDVTAEDLPEPVRSGLVAPGRFELAVQQPTEALAQLCGWAVAQGTPLEDLDVRAPSLEESYLALTEAAP
ncbi:MAG: transporter [Thermoleophilia bacterium]|nr:transporter [Thermoleophilia bacterium]